MGARLSASWAFVASAQQMPKADWDCVADGARRARNLKSGPLGRLGAGIGGELLTSASYPSRFPVCGYRMIFDCVYTLLSDLCSNLRAGLDAKLPGAFERGVVAPSGTRQSGLSAPPVPWPSMFKLS